MKLPLKSSCIILLITVLSTPGIGQNAPVFENRSEQLTESGYVQLQWQWNAAGADRNLYDFELQQSTEPGFEQATTIYLGPDYATFLSGLKNGNYYHRLRAVSKNGDAKSAWSEPVLIRVKHHSLQLALTLFCIGAVVFLLTVGIVVQGNRATTDLP